MTTVDKIRNDIIDKLLAISNEDYLSALYLLLEKSEADTVVRLSEEQKMMLELSERDIEEGDLISQEQLDKEDREWLTELNWLD